MLSPSDLFLQLRNRYPTGGILSELLPGPENLWVVRVQIQVEQTILATGMAAAATIESAEDQARIRAIGVLGLLPEPRAAVSSEVPSEATSWVSPLPIVPEPLNPTPPDPIAPPLAEVEPKSPSKAKTSRKKREESAPDSFSESLSEELTQLSSPPTTAKDLPAYDFGSGFGSGFDGDLLSLPTPDFTPEADLGQAKSSVPVESVDASPQSIKTVVTETVSTVSFPSASTTDHTANTATAIDFSPLGQSEAQGQESETTPFNELINEPIDLSDAIAQIGAEIGRIGWTKKQGSTYLQETYGKKTRAELTEAELFEFLHYLKALPSKGHPSLSQIPF